MPVYDEYFKKKTKRKEFILISVESYNKGVVLV